MSVLEGNENKLKTTPNDRWVASAVILSFIGNSNNEENLTK